MTKETAPELVVRDARAWQAWLDKHHASSSGVFLVLSKKGTTKPTSLTHSQALEEALCHGWIDGQAGPRDETTWRVRFTPRRKRSMWSKRNTVMAEKLLEAGRMHPAGIAEVDQARADGRSRLRRFCRHRGATRPREGAGREAESKGDVRNP